MKNIFLLLGICLSGLIACQSGEQTEVGMTNNTDRKEEQNEKGAALFQQHCASCHNLMKDATGPALKVLIHRVPDKNWIYSFVHDPAKTIAEGDAYATQLFEQWNHSVMMPFPQLSNEEIDAVMEYCGAYK